MSDDGWIKGTERLPEMAEVPCGLEAMPRPPRRSRDVLIWTGSTVEKAYLVSEVSAGRAGTYWELPDSEDPWGLDLSDVKYWRELPAPPVEG